MTEWTESEKQFLADQVQRMGRRPARAKVEGHPHNSVVNKIKELRSQGIITRKFVKRTKVSEPFTTGEIRFIREHTVNAVNGSRMSAFQLAKLPEMKRHTKESIATLIKNFGFADQVRSRRIKLSYRLTAYEKSKVILFLKNEGKFWPTQAVADHFDYKVTQVRRLRHKHNLQLVHSEEALKDSVYQKWYEHREKLRIGFIKNAFRNRARNILDQMLKARQEARATGGQPEKLCALCNQSWPATAVFFRIRKRKDSSGQEVERLTSRCNACPVKAKIPNKK